MSRKSYGVVLLLHTSQIPVCIFFFVQAEDGIRDLVRSRGLGDVYKRQVEGRLVLAAGALAKAPGEEFRIAAALLVVAHAHLSLIHI